MGRLNKKQNQKKLTVAKTAGISKSAVLATLAKKDEDRYDAINFKNPKPLPKTLDELDENPDFQLLLDVPNFKDKSAKPGTFNNKIKKKDRMKVKKDLLRKKLHVIELLKDEEKATKKRQKTAVVGDMKPMVDTLQVIDDLIKEDDEIKQKKLAEQSNIKKASKGTLKQKKAKAQFMKNMTLFNQINNHPEYVKNPFKTISTHIENKMLLESSQ